MKKSYLTNVILLLLIIGLYWFINYQPVQVESHRLSTLLAKQVHDIKIQRYKRDDIVLHKEGQQWHIKQPIQASANTTRINLILDLLSSHSQGQLNLDSKLSLQQYDLDPAKITLQINDQQFEFGNTEPLSKYRYILYDNIIHLLNDTVAPLLNANAASFINNRLFSEELNITRLSLPALDNQQVHSAFLSIKLIDGHWKTQGDTLSTDQLTSLVTAWQNAYAMQVLPLTADKIQHAIGQDITVEFSNQTTVTLLLQFNHQTMSLIDAKKKLKYQFPLSVTEQLFPIKDSAN